MLEKFNQKCDKYLTRLTILFLLAVAFVFATVLNRWPEIPPKAAAAEGTADLARDINPNTGQLVGPSVNADPTMSWKVTKVVPLGDTLKAYHMENRSAFQVTIFETVKGSLLYRRDNNAHYMWKTDMTYCTMGGLCLYYLSDNLGNRITLVETRSGLLGMKTM